MNPAEAVIQVGDGGRGFLVRLRRHGTVIITAAHCLPHLPPSHPMSYTEERTYGRLVGALNTRRTIAAECLFVDPIHDVAILAGPDNQQLADEAEAYETFTEERPALRLGRLPAPAPGQVYTLDNAWEACDLRPSPNGTFLFVEGAEGARIRSGMSGSPILDAAGRVVALVSTSAGGPGQPMAGGPNPVLSLVLPVWIVRASG